MRTLVIALTIFLGPALSAAENGPAVSTDDICAVRPDLCGGTPRQRRRRPRPANLDFADFDESARPPERRPAALQSGSFRQAAEAKPARPRRQRISFSSYMNANHSHSALRSRGTGMQDAFQAPPRPVSYTMGVTSGQSVRENAPVIAAPPAPPATPPAP